MDYLKETFGITKIDTKKGTAHKDEQTVKVGISRLFKTVLLPDKLKANTFLL